MNLRSILVIVLATIMLASVTPLAFADTLTRENFVQGNFSKTVDFFDYARAFAANHSMTPPGPNDHAYLHMNYINTTGLKLLYAGLDNITLAGGLTLRIPMQSFIMHYKTNNKSRDVILGNTFLMLLAFNDSTTSLYANSPDMNDDLWASFTLSATLNETNPTLPQLDSRTEIIPLQSSNNGLTWTWGMKYVNLVAFWWKTYVNPTHPDFDTNWLAAVTVYDELTFTYRLDINTTSKTATIAENHVIGRMRDLLWHPFFSIWIHYNSTGAYGPQGLVRLSNETIYNFLEKWNIKISIVNFQTSIVADHETYSTTPSGENAAENEVPINTTLSTFTDDGEKISQDNFGAKETYKLFNNTSDPTETQFETYNSTARTTKAAGYAKNTGLFTYHIALLKFLPLVVINMHPAMFQKAVETISNMSRANYFYVIGYPTYSGYRIEHDPAITVYLTTETSQTEIPGNAPFPAVPVIIAIAVIVVILVATVTLMRRKPKPLRQNPPQT